MCRSKHFPSTYVYIRNRAAEPQRRVGHRQPTGGDCRVATLAGARHRAVPGHQRGLATITGARHLPGAPSAHLAAHLPGESALSAHH